MRKKRLSVLGSGGLANIITEAYLKGLLDEYDLICFCGRNREKTEALAAKANCRAVFSPEDMLALDPDITAELASVSAVKENALAILGKGVDLVPLSIGAFADKEFYGRVKICAAENDAHVYLPSGAIGGFDIMQTITLMGDCDVRFSMKKGAAAMKGTPVFSENLLTETATRTVFSGTAGQAIELLPTKVNIAIATALATTGIDNVKTRIDIVPGMEDDDITIEISGSEASAVLNFYSKPADIAGWSVVSLLRSLVSPVLFI